MDSNVLSWRRWPTEGWWAPQRERCTLPFSIQIVATIKLEEPFVSTMRPEKWLLEKVQKFLSQLSCTIQSKVHWCEWLKKLWMVIHEHASYTYLGPRWLKQPLGRYRLKPDRYWTLNMFIAHDTCIRKEARFIARNGCAVHISHPAGYVWMLVTKPPRVPAESNACSVHSSACDYRVIDIIRC